MDGRNLVISRKCGKKRPKLGESYKTVHMIKTHLHDDLKVFRMAITTKRGFIVAFISVFICVVCLGHARGFGSFKNYYLLLT